MPVAKKTATAKKTLSEVVPKTELIEEVKKIEPEVKKEEVKATVPEVTENKNQVIFKAPQASRPLPMPVRVATPPQQAYVDPNVEAISGALDIMPDGQGFVRPKFTPSPKDAVLSSMLIRRWGLRMGDIVSGTMRVARENEKYNAMASLQKVNGVQLTTPLRRPEFRDLVPVYAEKQGKIGNGSNFYFNQNY